MSRLLVLACFPIVAFAAPRELTSTPVALPGGPGRVAMDYLAIDGATGQLWVPAGNTGNVDVLELSSLKVTAIGGFPTAARGERTVGPSSVALGAGVAYVGNRADSQVCAVAVKTLKKGGCLTLASSPDGVAYVAATKELWVTTPRDGSLTIVEVSSPLAPRAKEVVKVGGQPEGYAVDVAQGRFFTNLEDGDATLVYDVKTRKQLARYSPGCGKEGPRGLAYDDAKGLLLVACTDKVVALDSKGAVVGQLETGGGVDNIDFVPGLRRLFVAAGKPGTLTVADVALDGKLSVLGTATTALGARVVVADAEGTGYVADSAGGRILVVRSGPR